MSGLATAYQEQREELARVRELGQELAAVQKDRTLNQAERAFLLALLTMQLGHTGRERVTRARLAEFTGLHPLSIPRVARRLEQAGRIVRMPCFDRGGRQSGNAYVLGPVGPGGAERRRSRHVRAWAREAPIPAYPERRRGRRRGEPRAPQRPPRTARGNRIAPPPTCAGAPPPRGDTGGHSPPGRWASQDGQDRQRASGADTEQGPSGALHPQPVPPEVRASLSALKSRTERLMEHRKARARLPNHQEGNDT